MSVYVGIDVHRKRSQVAVLTGEGTVGFNNNVVNGRQRPRPVPTARCVSPVHSVSDGSFTFGSPDERLLLWLQLRLSDQLRT